MSKPFDELREKMAPERREMNRVMGQRLVEEQPAPTPNGSRPIWEIVVEDMQARDLVGRERYGVPLQAGNGRDALRDAYDEALDMSVYLRQALAERDAEAGAHLRARPSRDWLEREVVRLQAREQELLECNTRLVEERRALDWLGCVRHFFRIAGQEHDILERPGVPEERSLKLGLRLVVEEFFEALEACVGDPWRRPPRAGHNPTWELSSARGAVMRIVEDATMRVDLPALADAIADALYVLLGLAIRCGVDMRRVFDLVHATNLTKQSGPVVDGKRGKPEGFVPPDVAGELRRQTRG